MLRSLPLSIPSTPVTHSGSRRSPHRSLLANRRAIRGAKALIFGGGSLIQDMTSQLNLPYHLSRPWYASRAKVGFGAVGLDAGPLASKWGRRLARRVLARASVVGVRNVESADLLRSIGVDRVVKTADLALACEVRETPLSDRIAVCLRPPVNGGIRPVDGRGEIQDAEWIQRAARALGPAGRQHGTRHSLRGDANRPGPCCA